MELTACIDLKNKEKSEKYHLEIQIKSKLNVILNVEHVFQVKSKKIIKKTFQGIEIVFVSQDIRDDILDVLMNVL